MYSLDGIIACKERISINQAGFAASFKAALEQRNDKKQTTAQLSDQYCCLHIPRLQKTANLYVKQALKCGKLEVFSH